MLPSVKCDRILMGIFWAQNFQVRKRCYICHNNKIQTMSSRLFELKMKINFTNKIFLIFQIWGVGSKWQCLLHCMFKCFSYKNLNCHRFNCTNSDGEWEEKHNQLSNGQWTCALELSEIELIAFSYCNSKMHGKIFMLVNSSSICGLSILCFSIVLYFFLAFKI